MDIEWIIAMLRSDAKVSSKIQRDMAEAKSLRNSDGESRDLYMSPTPEQTVSGRAADAIETLLASLTAKIAEIAALRAALAMASNALESLDAGTMRTYKARNGRDVGIKADDGEACDIIHSDITHECLIALEVARSALHENPESKA